MSAKRFENNCTGGHARAITLFSFIAPIKSDEAKQLSADELMTFGDLSWTFVSIIYIPNSDFI